jgi:hypothetical protein
MPKYVGLICAAVVVILMMASANVGCDDGGNDDGAGGSCSGGYDDKDDDNEDWALWDENDDHFYMIPFRASSGYKPPQNGQMSVSPHKFLCHYFYCHFV